MRVSTSWSAKADQPLTNRVTPRKRKVVPRVKRRTIENVAAAHFAQAVEQFAGVVKQHARLPPLTHQLGDDVAHAAIAIGEDAGVVAVAAAHHVVEVTDHVRMPQVAAARGDQRLVHVQCHGEDGLQAVEV
jgi:hypothetical protein